MKLSSVVYQTRNDSKWHSWQSDHQFRSNPAIEAASCKQNWHVDFFSIRRYLVA